MNESRQPSVTVIRSGQTYEGKQGLTYGEGIFAGNTGAQAICMHLLTIPPGGRAKGHYLSLIHISIATSTPASA